MKQVLPKIFLLTGYCNTYYIDDKVKLLIDAGADFKGEVDILVLTHLHPDHVFYASKIKQRTGCKILIGENDAFLKVIEKFFSEWDGKKIKLFTVDKVLKEGDFLETGDYSFKIIHAPGHTKGSICLHDEKKGILFSGDVLFADGFIGRTDFPHSEPRKMSKSLKKLEKLDYKILLPGHGRIIL